MNISFEKIPRTTKLYSDYLYRFPRVSEFYSGDYEKDKAYLDVLSGIDQKEYQREELVSLLFKQNQKFGCPGDVLKRIELLKNSSWCGVLTGQQAGVFGGPLYTFYKAISAIKLSQKLSSQFKRDFIPIFWLSSDDHDFEEVKSIQIIDKDNNLVTFNYQPEQDIQGKPMSQIFLDNRIGSLIQNAERSFFDTDFKADIFEKLKRFYQKGETIITAFAKWLSFSLGKYGLLIIDPSGQDFKKLALPIFLKEVEDFGKSNELLKKTNTRLKTSGYHLQVNKSADFANVFFHKNKRYRLRCDGDEFVVDKVGQRFKEDKLKKLITENPAQISPNVILKTVAQSHVIPTAVYVGGPGEISYFAQTKEIFDYFSVPMPVIYPRASLTLIERKIQKILDKYQLPLVELFSDAEGLINSVMRKNFPDHLENRLKSVRKNVKKEINSLVEIIKFDPSLEKTKDTTQGRIEDQLKSLEKKVFRAHKKQNQITRDQIYKAQTNLFPQERLQERGLSILPFLVKYGWDLTDFLYDKIDISTKDHQVIKVGLETKI